MEDDGSLDTIEASKKTRGEAWLRQVIESPTKDEAELSLMLCDGIWFQRNKEIFEGKHTDPAMTAAVVTSSLTNFRDSNGWPERTSPELDVHALVRPPENGVKLYFDAGVNSDATGVGVVEIGEEGEFPQARERRYPGVIDAALAECMALEDAINMVKEMNARQPVFIGDTLAVIRMVRADEIAPLTCINQVARIQGLLDTHGFSPPFWTNRENNLLAHSLAAHAKTGTIDSFDWPSTPPFFLSLDTGRILVV